MPKFQKEFPKNAIQFFHHSSDEAFKKAHPVGYFILVCCGIIALLLPLIVLILITEIWFPAPNSGFYLPAMAGAFIMGIGLFNIVAAWINQYLGHWVTIGSLLTGGSIVSASLFILYTPGVYALFDERMVTYYFVSLLIGCLPPLFYIMFRKAVDSWLRRKSISKTKIKQLKKGYRNYWWYDALHKEVGLGLIHPMNKLFTILYPTFLILTLTLGWLRFMTPVISGMFAVISIIQSGMILFSTVQYNLHDYGKPFVILRRTETNRLTSFVSDFTLAAFPLLVAYIHIIVMLEAIG